MERSESIGRNERSCPSLLLDHGLSVSVQRLANNTRMNECKLVRELSGNWPLVIGMILRIVKLLTVAQSEVSQDVIAVDEANDLIIVSAVK